MPQHSLTVARSMAWERGCLREHAASRRVFIAGLKAGT